MPYPSKEICPICRQYSVRQKTLKVTGDVYAICENYPECPYVSRLETPALDMASVRPSA